MDSFPVRRAAPEPWLLSSLADLTGAPTPRADMPVRGVAPLADAGPDDLGFLADRGYVADLASSRAGALLVAENLDPLIASDPRPRLVVHDGHAALATILEALFPGGDLTPEIHSTAVLGRGVRLGRGARIGPYAVVESGAEIGDGAAIGAHVVVGAGARVGAGSILHPHAVVYPGTELGARVILHSGCAVGVDGFGYAAKDGRPAKVPQVGRCVIEDDVEVGANTTIDRGSIGATRVGRGAKLDNLVQIAHNVTVGPAALLAAQVGVAGSSRIGAGVRAGGQAGIAGHLTVGDGAQLAAQAGVVGDIPPGETVMGFPARPRTEFLRATAAASKVPDLAKRVAALERARRDE